MRIFLCNILILLLFATSCASEWKIHGGPRECKKMCRKWNMKLTGMVGVGSQKTYGPGATACVCEVKKRMSTKAESGVATSTAAIITALQEAERQKQERNNSSKTNYSSH